ncbi:MAG: hypothetical protein ACLRMJ_09995 [Alistipes finegoldii]
MNIAQQQKLMSRTIWLAGIFLIVLIAILWFVLWQHRRLQGSHEQLIRMSDLLREARRTAEKERPYPRHQQRAGRFQPSGPLRLPLYRPFGPLHQAD